MLAMPAKPPKFAKLAKLAKPAKVGSKPRGREDGTSLQLVAGRPPICGGDEEAARRVVGARVMDSHHPNLRDSPTHT